MQKTIYVKEEKLWDDLKTKAEVLGISVSEYLMRGVSGLPSSAEMGRSGNQAGKSDSLIFPILERIESKLDEILVREMRFEAKTARGNPIMSGEEDDAEYMIGGKAVSQKEYEVYAGRNKTGVPVEDELVVANDRLLKVRKERKIQSLTGHSGPLPKSGKKGK